MSRMPEGQEVTIPKPEYFTKEELDHAKVGVQEFQDIYKRCEPQVKLFLKEAQGGKYLQAKCGKFIRSVWNE